MNLLQLFEASKLTKAEHGMGMTSFQNDSILLAGGMRSGNSKYDETRLKYIVYDIKGLSKEEFQKNQKDYERGHVEVFVEDSTGKIRGLVNIELKKSNRRSGLGREIIQSLQKTVNGDLNIHDIKRSAIPFWKKMGVKFDTKHEKPTMKQLQLMTKHSGLNGVIPK